ncbi:heavy-metal-associated domain-containing protein [Flavobacterium sp. LS1R47]|jgi:copper chaperone|uniref:Heavy-metal-associated domain-containing protein n=1 Tax=Flavobacterium frigoritolerans TaxID=2987686 RepID=A0A9X3HMH7_9FLAO|nr:heavy-metal-associated domain-containing protein [Flavobacterium frigoritolerans]MCV9934102.1 heavy-metal-associated domain-containing protein [Flavobacterium frigoritolerans]
MENNNQNLHFKTNINCSSCVTKVTPFLDDAEGICHWDVDTTGRDKVLTVKSEGITEQEIIETVLKAGFKIEPYALKVE